jgi:hypothetical protein
MLRLNRYENLLSPSVMQLHVHVKLHTFNVTVFICNFKQVEIITIYRLNNNNNNFIVYAKHWDV